MTNGIGNPSPHMRLRVGSHGAINRARAALVFGAAMLAVIIVLSVLTTTGIIGRLPTPAITIDGQFADWDDAYCVSFTQGSGSRYAIASAAMLVSEGRLFLLLRTAGPILQGGAPANRTMDTVYASLDLDADSGTGYALKGLGADAMVIVEGWNGIPRTRNLHIFGSGASRHDWHGFGLDGSIAAASAGDSLEVEIPWSRLGGERADVRVLWAVAGYDGQLEWASVLLSLAEPVVSVMQSSMVSESILTPGMDADVLSLALVANHECAVTGMEFSSPVTLRDRDGILSLPVQLKAGEERRLTVSARVPDSDALFNLTLRNISLSPEGSFLLSGKHASAYVRDAPHRIAIDGAFGDWNAVEKHSDAAGDAGTPTIDIRQTASVGMGNSTFFYVEVGGKILDGTRIPERNSVATEPAGSSGNEGSGGAEGGAPIPVLYLPPLYGEDALRIFVDADNDPLTGYAIADNALVRSSPGVIVSGIPGDTIGADYMVNVTGKDGTIWTSEVLRFSGTYRTQWQWSAFSATEAANDDMRIEVGIEGLNLTGMPLLVQAKGWKHEDRASLSIETMASALTRSISRTEALSDAAPPSVLAPPPPPSPSAEFIDGDWIVSDTNVTENKEIILNGNLTITPTGSLTLNNVTLRINQSANGTCTIKVENGGELYVVGGSNITSNNTYYYLFVVYGRLRVNDTAISMMDVLSGSWGGIHVYSNDVHVGNSTIFNCWGAGMTIEGNRTTVYNTTFHHSYRGILLEYWARLTVNQCIFHNLTNTAIDAADNCVVWVNETGFTDIKYYGVYAYWYTTAKISNCTFLNITERHIFAFAYSTIRLNDSSIQNNNEWWGVYARDNSNVFIRNLTATGCDRAIDVSLYSTLTLDNSNISGNVQSGVYLSQSTAAITNCSISNNSQTGVYVSSSNATITNCTINNNSGGVRVGSGFFNTTITNSTIAGNVIGVECGSANTTLLNSTVSSTSANFSLSSEGRIFVKWFLHVLVLNQSDVPIPNANVKVYDKYGTLIFDGYTGADGWRRWIIVTNMSMYRPGINPVETTYYDPHNITAEYNAVTNSTTETMNVSKEVVIRLDYQFASPLPPTNLTLSLSGDDIVLAWNNTPQPDLAYYRIYRCDEPGGFDFTTPYHNTSGDPNPLAETWTDVDAANDWKRHFYIVRAVNGAHEEETNTNTVWNGDWIVENTQSHNDLNVPLYGNLTILSTGNLTLNNVTLRINQTDNGTCTINVTAGGQLYVNQGSNITSNNTYYYLFVVYGRLRVNDTAISMMDILSGSWGGIHVYSNDVYVGNSTIFNNKGAGITVEGKNLTVCNTTFYNCYRGILVETESNLTVEGCTFRQLGDTGIDSSEGGTVKVNNSDFYDIVYWGVMAYWQVSASISNCTFVNVSEKAVYALAYVTLWLNDSAFENNDIWGVYIRDHSIAYIRNISANGSDTGVDVSLYSEVTIADSNLSGNAQSGIYISQSTATITNCSISNNSQTGVYVSSSNVTITNCTIEGNGNGVYSCYDANVTLLNSTVQNSIGSDLTVTYGGWIFVKWFLHVLVLNNTDVPIPNANIQVYDVFNNLVFDGYTGSDGWRRWIIVTNRTLNHSDAPTDPTTIIYYTPHNITATYSTASNYTTQTMNVSKVVIIKLDVEIIPEFSGMLVPLLVGVCLPLIIRKKLGRKRDGIGK
ncbi:MAG: right-handed parallel beta-helix repeat-containing protein [Candidatus Thermoplasmatota archaeon]